ncbi:unnamed protein product [Lupinus luteus]|uniref:Uncharacterized protein n=1 Tax=Lupinus luteus TaxID=3873 RepID=A0AAV1YJ56_LUPLU
MPNRAEGADSSLFERKVQSACRLGARIPLRRGKSNRSHKKVWKNSPKTKPKMQIIPTKTCRLNLSSNQTGTSSFYATWQIEPSVQTNLNQHLLHDLAYFSFGSTGKIINEAKEGGQVAPLSTCLSNFDCADFELAWCLPIWPDARFIA